MLPLFCRGAFTFQQEERERERKNTCLEKQSAYYLNIPSFDYDVCMCVVNMVSNMIIVSQAHLLYLKADCQAEILFHGDYQPI